jgi:hypothetical protein
VYYKSISDKKLNGFQLLLWGIEMFDLCNVANESGFFGGGNNSEWDCCPTSLDSIKFENFCALRVQWVLRVQNKLVYPFIDSACV